MDKNAGRSLPEWLQRHLPDDPLIAWDIATKMSKENQGKNGLGRSLVRKGDRNENLNEKQDEADAVVGEPYPGRLAPGSFYTLDGGRGSVRGPSSGGVSIAANTNLRFFP
ncbi:MAG: hypothetical protein EOS23_18580 [Mesorhizobium sp.]|uniref:hypothetical protein n=1 Tax=unclassified Mesorhizobium TaxID=325217 RepID=UPI000FD58B71|nr:MULTISPECIES: hypothetical protein [unclassified Mesorhizobium]RUV54188.1 hypothetical protein EOA88_36860 [Mesorhizobium sp. M5C.F.Ca.IN.020.14.1.1]RUV29398.1 hypothetical protein EOA86_15735 [Mesorhizobium sp. M5C.F.Ca.IN.020.32.2.1]RWC42476.1 MAG: hypothetical protein EOS28_16990 [Mesorhizobium sp.]RWE09456.1 MAG: hypothetical protein EOS23_18580 [Mesorhizobium sp.]RWE82566.1 MAG: hypothetical protein EOS49_26890 [Mesorhizobium sp.]